VLGCWLPGAGQAAESRAPSAAPYVAIIIDDLGNHDGVGRRVAALPGPVTCSILPHTPHSARLAGECHRSGKEVMLHLPMQPGRVSERPGPGSLAQGQARAQVTRRVQRGFADVPFATGVNNHMGSHLTRHLAYMHWVMESLREEGARFFVDSYTSPTSVALEVARVNGLPAIRRDVFLDHRTDRAHIRRQLQVLRAVALREGAALAIGHPHATTLSELERALPELAADGIMLVSVSALIHHQDQDLESWQASSYPSPTASRKSRPSPSSTCCDAPASRSSSPAWPTAPSGAPTTSQ
jgi:polysaccharide deacetylase 2 family uncharacterized protein YibQ